MIKFKNRTILSLFVLFTISINSILAQDVTSIEATTEDISDNLDLEAVASIFGESKDLEDFEKRLNDPKTQISNLDLNNDGEVDYLRIMESSEKNVHSISIQAIICKDQYQEVAVIDVRKDSTGTSNVQVVGNVDMYGSNYYITPYYSVVPVFFTFFWAAAYHPWHSPWYWGYQPPYFNPWHPYPAYRYRANVHVHVNVHNSYNRTNVRINNTNNKRNNDYFKNNPDKSFSKRNPGTTNRNDLNTTRKNTSNNNTNLASVEKKDYKSTGKPATKPSSRPPTTSNIKATTRPSTKPSAKPSSKPITKPSPRPSNNSYSRPKPSSSSYSRKSPSRSSHTRTRR